MIKSSKKEDITIASITGTSRFNALVSDQAKEEFKALFNSPGTRLVLDLGGVSFIDSTGFGVFLSILKTANYTGGHLKICNIDNNVIELFKLLQLHHVFEIYDTVDDAVRSYSGVLR